MKSLKSIFLVCILIAVSAEVFAQRSPEKFGKIDIEDLKSTVCPIDSNAHTYYIFDFGRVYFDYDTKSGGSGGGRFKLLHKRHFRIKILDNQALSWADIQVPLYRDKDEDKITDVKAVTYNLEGEKIVKTKFSRKDILTEETSKNWITAKFALPAVRKGSVIEVEYTVQSYYYFNLPVLRFQHAIPSLHSEHEVDIPEYFNYSETQSGYYPVQRTTGSKAGSVTFVRTERTQAPGFSATKTQTHRNTVEYQNNTYNFKAQNIPAFPKEKFLKTRENYISKVEFELQSTKFPRQEMRYYSVSWESVDAQMHKSYDFLGKTRHLNELIEVLKASGKEGLPLMSATFEAVKKHFSWNKRASKYPTSTPVKAFKEKEGNAADINLNLVSLLREVGFESNPVILSTQSNGIIHPANASLSSFNYVIASVKIEEKTYLLDATDPYSEINLLPVRCLNDRGRVIGQSAEKWVNLMDYSSFGLTWTYNLALGKDLAVEGKASGKLKDYAAYAKRLELAKTNEDTEEESDEEEDKNANRVLKEMTLKGAGTLGSDIVVSYGVRESDYAEESGDMIYFSAVFDPFFEENPFKLEKREFPVEFNHPYQIFQVYSFELPEGYEVSEMPEPLLTKLPSDGVRFLFQTTIMGNRLNVTSRLTVKKSMFLPEEYGNLKKIFQLMIDKQQELVVLKKKQ